MASSRTTGRVARPGRQAHKRCKVGGRRDDAVTPEQLTAARRCTNIRSDQTFGSGVRIESPAPMRTWHASCIVLVTAERSDMSNAWHLLRDREPGTNVWRTTFC